jgi:hypothetical protein
MKKTTLGLVAASALLTTTAFSQITVSGYNETSIFSGDTIGGPAVTTTSSIGNETVIRVAGTGKLTNGMSASFYGLLDSDQGVAAGQSVLGERGFDINLTPDFSVQYGYDRVMGSEIARTLTPFATNRIADVTTSTATIDFQDVTSGEHAVGINLNNLLGAGSQLSLAWAPNMDATNAQTNDGLTNTAGQSGYGGAIKVVPVAGLTIGAGYTKANTIVATAEDLTAKTLGFTYARAPFAIGAQASRMEGQKAAVASTSPSIDDVNVYSGTYAVTKELTLGLAYSTLDRTRGTKSLVDAKVTTLSVAYNLGPVVVSLDREQAENAAAATTSNNVNGNDTNINKLKVRVAF